MTDLTYIFINFRNQEERKVADHLPTQTHNGFAIKRGKITMEIHKEPEKEKKIENRFHRRPFV